MMLSLCEKQNLSCEGKAYCHIAKENAATQNISGL